MRILGWDERKFIEFIKGKIGDPSVLVDVGFNRGYFTEEWLENFPNSKVFGFEPIGELANIGKENFANNKNVRIFNVGLHNEDCNKKLYFLHNGFDGMSSIHYRPVYYPRFEYTEIEVKLERLDNFITSLPQIDYMKIDTEGNEVFVLEGADQILRTIPPTFIQFEYGECYQDSKTTGRQIVRLLQKYKYVIYNRDLTIVTPDTFVENYDLQNYLAVFNG